MDKLEYTIFYAIGISFITFHIWTHFGIKDLIIKLNFEEKMGQEE